MRSGVAADRVHLLRDELTHLDVVEDRVPVAGHEGELLAAARPPATVREREQLPLEETLGGLGRRRAGASELEQVEDVRLEVTGARVAASIPPVPTAGVGVALDREPPQVPVGIGQKARSTSQRFRSARYALDVRDVLVAEVDSELGDPGAFGIPGAPSYRPRMRSRMSFAANGRPVVVGIGPRGASRVVVRSNSLMSQVSPAVTS